MIKYSIRCTLMPTEHTDGTHTIRFRITWNGQRVTYYLANSIKDTEWDERINRPKRNAHKANKEIDFLTSNIDGLFDRCHIERRIPTVEDVRTALRESYQTYQADKSPLLIDVMEQLMEDSTIGGAWSKNTRRNYLLLYSKVKGWNPQQRISEFGKIEITDFMKHCYDKGLINSTVQKFLKQLRWTIRTAAEHNLCSLTEAVNFHPRYKSESENEVVYLSKEELRQLIELDLSQHARLDSVRDVFLFCCFTGLRYSDVSKLQWDDIHDNQIRVVTQKTSDTLYIDLNQVSKLLIEKYNTSLKKERVFPIISNQKMNDYLKIIAKMANIDKPVRRVWWVKAERFEKSVPKWQVLTTHCGRKTFVVSALSLDIASEVVMKWTGHKAHKTMKPYIAIVDDLKKKQMTKFDTLIPEMTKI